MYFCFRVLYFQKYKKTITFSITFSMLGEPGLYFLYFLHYLGCVGWMKWRLRCSDVVLQKAPTISYNTKNCASCLFVFLEWLTNSPFTFDPFVAIAKLIIILVESWLVLSWFILVKLVFLLPSWTHAMIIILVCVRVFVPVLLPLHQSIFVVVLESHLSSTHSIDWCAVAIVQRDCLPHRLTGPLNSKIRTTSGMPVIFLCRPYFLLCI